MPIAPWVGIYRFLRGFVAGGGGLPGGVRRRRTGDFPPVPRSPATSFRTAPVMARTDIFQKTTKTNHIGIDKIYCYYYN